MVLTTIIPTSNPQRNLIWLKYLFSVTRIASHILMHIISGIRRQVVGLNNFNFTVTVVSCAFLMSWTDHSNNPTVSNTHISSKSSQKISSFNRGRKWIKKNLWIQLTKQEVFVCIPFLGPVSVIITIILVCWEQTRGRGGFS